MCAVRIKTCGAATNCFTGNDEFSHSTLIMVSLWYTFGITVLSMRSLFSRPFFGKMLMVGNRAAMSAKQRLQELFAKQPWVDMEGSEMDTQPGGHGGNLKLPTTRGFSLKKHPQILWF